MQLLNKTAFVTAAAQGIGKATVLAMAKEGARVIATDVRADLLEELQGISGVETARLDVLNKADIEQAARKFAGVDVLFNCAGVVHNGTLLEASDADFEFAMQLNVRSQFWTIQAFLPAMLKGGGGSIINMASVCSIKGLVNRFVYSASKAAVIGLTKSVAADYVKEGVRCNAVMPGTVDTPSLGDRINAHADPVAARAAFIARQPMGRLAKAEEIAPLLVYLASDAAAFVTGQAISIDGGMTI